MKQQSVIVVLVVLVAAWVTALSISIHAGQQASAKQTGKKKPVKVFKATCPVKGEPALQDMSVTLQGKQIYFCCPSCPSEFEVDPSSFQTRTHFQFLQTGQIVQVACPISGHELDPDESVKVGSLKVTFCCPNCTANTKKAKGDKQLALIFANISKGFTRQTKCLVSGKTIKPAHVVTYKKQKVYFCCPNCPKTFRKSPEKFAGKIPQLKPVKKN